jgi:hypothetical protein
MNWFHCFLFTCVDAVLIFTTFPNHCLEVTHDHWFIKPCRVISTQNFQYIDETHYLCLVSETSESNQCLILDTPQLPLRFEISGDKQREEHQFDLIPALGHGYRGVLIRKRGSNLCAAIIDQNYPLHFQVCDTFSAMQTFSFGGAFKPPQVQKLVRPAIFRLSTT